MGWTREQKKAINLEFYKACREIFELLRENNIDEIVLQPKGPKATRIAVDNARIYCIYNDLDIFYKNGDWVESEYTFATQNRNGKIRKRRFMAPKEQVNFVHFYETTLYDQFQNEVENRKGLENPITRKK